MTVRSLLFVPGHRPDRFDKALACGADAIVLDLEDAAPPQLKEQARAAVCAWLLQRRCLLERRDAAAPLVLARVNGRATPWFDADVAACRRAGLREWMLPKAERPDDLAALPPEAGIWPLVETAQGMAHAEAIAAAAGVRRLVFGSLDFQADLGIEPDEDERQLQPYRARLVLASRLAQLPAPVDGVTTALDDAPLLERAARRALREGFGAKLCIHPRQVHVLHRAMRPAGAAVASARRILQAAEAAGGAAVALDGLMVDRPVILRAQAVLARAGISHSHHQESDP